jgi:hypothetical protein
MDHVIKEAIEITLYPKNFNRDGGFTLSQSWCPVTNMLKQYKDTPIWKQGQAKQAFDCPLVPHWLILRFKHGLWVDIYVRQSGHSYITALMMGTEIVPETLVIFNQVTWLIAQEDFINVIRHESFRSYICCTSIAKWSRTIYSP